jgi:hypothetical protein
MVNEMTLLRAHRRTAACILCAFALAALTSAALSQTPAPATPAAPITTPAPANAKLPKWRIDPYTKNKPEALSKAGYASFGPFPFGNLGAKAVTTDDVEKTLPYLQIHWIETAHFRIGIDLPAWNVPQDPEIKAKLRKELERLAEKLPGINTKPRTLDPWLRAHLFAQRCEDIYSEFMQLAMVTDDDFPQKASDIYVPVHNRAMGMGPYLGMKEKYLLMLFEKEGSFNTYMKTYLGRDSHFGQRWHCKDVGCILFTIATECDEGRHKDDTALHGSVAFNVSQNLLDGFRHYSYDMPVWLREGLGHWFERRVSPRFNSFDQNEGSPADMKKEWKWQPYTKNLVTTGGKFAPFPEAYAWRDFGNITFNDHVAIWSRMDFMMQQGPEKWSKFLFEVKGRSSTNGTADQSDLVGAFREGIQKAYGFSVLQFDEKWAEWVKANYASQ